ncbi:MAG: D-2-hydroxyacid dehydrogenase [Lachnospiraceae bacterium]|nr:D-2-hydroxyacid dehydrogenase [Lachnospiraceae bacterium]
MKIVFMEAETLGEDVDLSHFSELGEVELYTRGQTAAENAERIHDADIIVVNKLPMDKDILDGAKHLKMIALSATGTNNVNFEYTKSRGIIVKNVKGYSTQSVVQHTFAMLFYLYEKLPKYDSFVKNGHYGRYHMFSCFTPYFHELSGKTWGVIGLGAIGRGVADVAKAFGCNVIYYSTSGNNNTSGYNRVSLDTLLENSDIISLHCALTESTANIINYSTLHKMKPDAVLLNLGRGPLVNESELADSLDDGIIAAAGLDVLCTEPIENDNPLLKIKDTDRLLITPHMAWGTIEARTRCVREVYNNIKEYITSI